MITEMGQNEKRIRSSHSLYERTKGWWETTTVRTAYNKHYDSGCDRQFGGVSIIAQGKIAHRILETERDPTGLGRWISMLVSGKKGCKTRIITAYRPTVGSNTPGSVSMQHHLYYYQKEGESYSPRKKFMEDLKEKIIQWRSKGEHIILGGDMNTGDKQTKEAQQRFWAPFLEATGLLDVHKHHLAMQQLPPTCERGSTQIDYLFVSPGLTIYRAGFMPFGKYPGDHRAIWVEILTQDIIGSNIEAPNSPAARRLKLQDPRTVKAYQALLLKKVQESGIDKEIHLLSSLSLTEWNKDQEKKYNEVSKKYRSYMLAAEKKCRKLKMGNHPWSIEFATARYKKFFWEMAFKHKKGVAIPTKKFLKLKKKLRIRNSLLNEDQLKEKVKQAKVEYQQVKRRTIQLRQTYRERLAESISQENNTRKEAELKALINREEMKETFRKIRWVRKGEANTAITKVTVTSAEGRRQVITDKRKVERALLDANLRKFQQTKGQCPLMKGSLRAHFGTTATNKKAEAVIRGNYIAPEKCRKSVKAYLKACKQPDSFTPASHDHFSLQQYRESWKTAKERTSSGKAHFGLWKAGARHAILGELEWKLSIIPGKYGFAPEVWKTATDVMLLKKEGLTDVEKLRTIVLYEADYNFINKRVGKQAMDNAMQNKLIAEEQYAKPRSDSSAQCVNRKIIFDLVRYARASFAMCSSDLKSCYDRIVHSAASLAMQKMGISQNQVKSMFLTIQECEHRVRTSFGDSEESYGGTKMAGEPISGVGQGNGAGPTIWAILSSVLFQAMHKKGYSIKFPAKLSNDVVELLGFMYVDDMDMIRVRPGYEKDQIQEDLQNTLDYWNKLIKVTGGALAPEKSNWYAYHHNWNEETGEYEIQDIQGRALTAKDKDNRRKALTFLSHATPQEMLGMLMSPDGNVSHQTEKLINISRTEGQVIGKSKLLPHEAKLALTHTIIPKLQYPLIVTSITQDEGKKILRPVIEATLQKMGIVKTLGYDHIHGSVGTQGLGIPEIYHLAYSRQIEFIVNQIWKDTQSGKLIKIAAQELVVELGSLSDPFDGEGPERLNEVILTQHTWLQQIRQYMQRHRIQMQLPIPKILPQRQGDKAIMDILATMGKERFRSKDLKDFNRCRIYKQVTLVSDIADTTGRKLAKRSRTQEKMCRSLAGQYGPQHLPNEDQWKAWKKGLKLMCGEDSHLLQPVGQWIKTKDNLQWDFYIQVQEKSLWKRQGTKWYRHQYRGRRWRTPLKFSNIPNLETHSNHLQGHLIPVTIYEEDDDYVVESETLIQDVVEAADRRNTVTSPTTTRIERSSLGEKIKEKAREKYKDTIWALCNVEEKGETSKIEEDFKKGKALFVGDGSYKDGQGAGAFLISTADGENYIVFSGPTPGPNSSQSPYRSEIGTMLGCSIVATTLEEITGVSPKIVLICDNEKALRSITKSSENIHSTLSDADLISTTIAIWKNSNIKIEIRDVDGHADDRKKMEELTIEEKLNCEVDNKAKETREQIMGKITTRQYSTNGLIQVKIGNTEITDNIAKNIQIHVAKNRSKMAGIRTSRYTEETFPMINHEALSRAMKTMPTQRQIFVTKWVARQLPVGKNMVTRKHRLYDGCPYCNTEEDMEHLWRCKHEEAITIFETQLEDFEKVLERMDTDPSIQHHLILAMRQWRELGNVQHTCLPSSIGDKHRFKPFAEQQKIGWNQFMEGLLSNQWATAIDRYKCHTKYWKNGEIWTKKVIETIWKMNFEIWAHRNKKLHETQGTLETLEGGEELDEAIRYEISVGTQGLHPDFQNLFKESSETILRKPIKHKKSWFKTVRAAKEAIGVNRRDKFAENATLRKWIGLKQL